MERLLELSELDLDFSDLEKSCAELTKLAAKVAGTSISVVNLIDSYTQWSVSSFGLDSKQSSREDSVCQYTILEENSGGFEVEDLSVDLRFKDKPYVSKSPFLKYYFGIPLKINENTSLGALCVLHDDYKYLTAEKKEMLGVIAGEVVNRIKTHVEITNLNRKVQEANSIKNRIAHDIRGPIGGIIGLAEIIQIQGNGNKIEEVLEFIDLIQKSGKSLLELTDEILSSNLAGQKHPKKSEFTLLSLKEKVLDMFGPQAITKNVVLTVQASVSMTEIPFQKTKILQILGNLISNSIKFTPAGGKVEVRLDLEIQKQEKILKLKVKDNGIGITPDKIEEILCGGTASSMGTSGEIGYGFGLNLVHQLVNKLNGRLLLKSELGQGVEFELIIPVS
ncbi:histidine kinase [Algoriphagus sp. A40]|nr:histidine kinase [Algoriphagus sp. A40]